MTSLTSHIRQIRPLRLDPEGGPQAVTKVRSWVSRLGQENSEVLLTVLGPTPADRAAVYRTMEGDIFQTIVDKSHYSYDWTGGSLIDNIFERISVSNILRDLASQEELSLGSELAPIIDKGFFRITEAFQVLWEARFLFDEGLEAEGLDLLKVLEDWSRGSIQEDPHLQLMGISKAVEANADKYDILFLWLTLARYSGIFDRLILPFDGFERVQSDSAKIDELRELIEAADRWKAVGNPLGIVIGIVDFNLHPDIKSLLLSSPIV